jgi:hypothetical protein
MNKNLFNKLFLTVGAFFIVAATPALQASTYRPHLDSHIAFNQEGPCLLTLEDGSQWKVPDSEQGTLNRWFWYSGYAPVPVTITPNYSLGTNYGYYLTYQGSYVRANLVASPLLDSPYTITITGFDKNQPGKKAIYLSNGTYWSVALADWDRIKNWYVNDLVIIGKNSEWFTPNTHILINIHTNTFVRVQKL